MIAPGMKFGAGGRIAATIGVGTVADFINQGVGFMNGGNLAIDTGAPAGSVNDEGIAQNASGAFYGTVTPNATDTWIAGVRVSAAGALIIESADAATFSNGNGITAAGNLSVN